MNDESEDHSVKFVRLKNGDDMVSEVVEVGDDNQIDYMIINPLKVVYLPSQQGASYLQVAFIPWVFRKICEDQEFLIHAEDVLTIGNVSEYMLDYYWENMNHFFQGKSEDDVKDEPEPEIEESETSLEEILETLRTARRTYH